MLLRPAHIPTALTVAIIPLHESVTLHLRAFSCPMGQVRGCRSTYRAVSSPGSNSYVMTLGVRGYIPQVPHLLVGIFGGKFSPCPPTSLSHFLSPLSLFTGINTPSPKKTCTQSLASWFVTWNLNKDILV